MLIIVGLVNSIRVRIRKAEKSKINIETNYLAGQIDADFLINLSPSSRLIIRLEINFRRINFNLYLTKGQVEKIPGCTDLAVQEMTAKDSTRRVLERIGHSVSGAGFSETRRVSVGDQDLNYQSGYVFNDQMIQRELAGQQYYCLVAMKTVSQQFICKSRSAFISALISCSCCEPCSTNVRNWRWMELFNPAPLPRLTRREGDAGPVPAGAGSVSLFRNRLHHAGDGPGAHGRQFDVLQDFVVILRDGLHGGLGLHLNDLVAALLQFAQQLGEGLRGMLVEIMHQDDAFAELVELLHRDVDHLLRLARLEIE